MKDGGREKTVNFEGTKLMLETWTEMFITLSYFYSLMSLSGKAAEKLSLNVLEVTACQRTVKCDCHTQHGRSSPPTQ